MSDRDIVLSWTPTRQEYERALGLWRDASGQRQRSRTRGATLAALGIILMGFAISSGGMKYPIAVLPLAGVIVIGAIWWRDRIPYWGLRSALRRTPSLVAPVEIRVSPETFTSRSDERIQRFAWSEFTARVDISDLVLLGMSPNSPAIAGIVPRSAASSEAAWDTFVSRARARVPLHPRLARMDQAPGSPR